MTEATTPPADENVGENIGDLLPIATDNAESNNYWKRSDLLSTAVNVVEKSNMNYASPQELANAVVSVAKILEEYTNS